MKKIICLFSALFALYFSSYAQNIKGEILADTGNLTVVKIWGTHYERGFAYGYLCSQKIMSVWNNYVIPRYGTYLPMAKFIIGNPSHFNIPSVYVTEGQAMLDGLGAAGADTSGLTYLDLFVVNFTTDLEGFMPKSFPAQHCSSLLNWAAATAGTDLNGKAVIAHHLDAPDIDTAITNNQVLVVHIPAETDEQPWLLTGTAGQFVASQTVNNSGLCVFLNTVNGFSAEQNKQYEPVTLTLRKTVEKKDYNNDNAHDVNDIRDAVNSNTNGYARGFIVCAIAPSTLVYDTLIATAIELAPQQPFITTRYVSFPDSINGVNLYAANSMIKRNNAYDFCSRYNNVKNEINNNYDGDSIGSQDNWDIMATQSTQTSNLQLIQVIPESRIFKIAVTDTTHLAYEKTPLIFNLDTLFSEPSVYINPPIDGAIQLQTYPNPFSDVIYMELPFSDKPYHYEITDFTGRILISSVVKTKETINLSGYKSGVYILKVFINNRPIIKKLIKL